MRNAVRWILIVPAMLASSACAYGALLLMWNMVRMTGIVFQDTIIDVLFGSAAINAGAAAAGVTAAARVAPSQSGRIAVVAAVMLILLAVVALFAGFWFRERLHISLGWHAFSSAAWVFGAIAAAVSIFKEEARRARRRAAPLEAEPPLQPETLL